MSVILSCENVVKRFTLKPVLEGVTCYIEENARIGIVGINGTGKSTFLKIAAGIEEMDEGTIQRRSGLTIACLPQMPDYREHRTAWEQVLLDALECPGQRGRVGLDGQSGQAALLHQRTEQFVQPLL